MKTYKIENAARTNFIERCRRAIKFSEYKAPDWLTQRAALLALQGTLGDSRMRTIRFVLYELVEHLNIKISVAIFFLWHREICRKSTAQLDVLMNRQLGLNPEREEEQ
jgi:hypothetical protein